jgi:hypothetical protein
MQEVEQVTAQDALACWQTKSELVKSEAHIKAASCMQLLVMSDC